MAWTRSSAIQNARRACELRDDFGSLAAYFWRFEPDPASRPTRLTWTVLRRIAVSPESTALAADLRKRGWSFVGPTTMYAFMQAVGLVDDHLERCAVRARVEHARRALPRRIVALRPDGRARRTASPLGD